MVASRTCAIPRVQWGFVLQKPAGNPSVVRPMNGGPVAMEINVQNIQVNHHELRMREDYTMYCIFCGQSDSQYNWVMTLESQPASSEI